MRALRAPKCAPAFSSSMRLWVIFRTVGQLSYVVEDLSCVVMGWENGGGPWTVIPHVTLDYFNIWGNLVNWIEIPNGFHRFNANWCGNVTMRHQCIGFIAEYGEGIQHVCFSRRITTQRWNHWLEREWMFVRMVRFGMRFAYLEGVDSNVRVRNIPKKVHCVDRMIFERCVLGWFWSSQILTNCPPSSDNDVSGVGLEAVVA